MGKIGPLCTGAGNHYGEQYGVSSKAEIGNRTTIQPRKFTSVFFPKKKPTKATQNTNSKRHMGPYVHCSVIYSIQDMEAT